MSFTAYIIHLNYLRWFNHDNHVLILDDGAIHSRAADACNMEDYLWDTGIDVYPLNIPVLFLPT
jgi:hypothetical protein